MMLSQGHGLSMSKRDVSRLYDMLDAARNRLIHGYFSVDLDIVWSIVRNDLSPLVKELEEITAEE